MGKRFGVYAVDRSESLAEPGYSDSTMTWKRTALARDGKVMAKTGQEFDRLGVHLRGDGIVVNGAAYGSGEVDRLGRMQGAVLQCDGDHCINITLEDYNLLRGGQIVKGFNRYDEKAVYNIVDNVSTATLIDKPDTDGMDDVTLNSLLAINDEDKPVGGTHNTLTEATMFCAADHGVSTAYYETTSPECVMRHFSPIISEDDGLELEYFVDTKYYDSVTNGRLGDTFTVIVEAANGQVLFKATTYAGQFKVTTKPFKTDADGVGDNLVGHTWFSIRCIDNHHVGSIERFFKVLIRPANYTPNIYQMTPQDLTAWRITPDTDSLEAGHYNRVGLEALFAAKKAANYDGVKLYNANPDADDEDTAFDDVANTKYYIDFHQVIESGNNFVPAGFKRFYLIHFADDVIKGIDKQMKDITLADFDSMELQSGQTITVDGKSVSVPSGTSPYEFIKADGAEIFRVTEGDDQGKIIVPFTNDLAQNEVSTPGEGVVTAVNEYTNKEEKRHLRGLRIRSLNVIIKNAREGNLWKSFNEYPEREGWYYASWFDGDWSDNIGIGIHANGMGGIAVPEGFTIDFNKTSFIKTDSTDITGNFYFFNINCHSDVHLKNGKLVGCFGRYDMKDAFLRTCKMGGGGTWEGGGDIKYKGAEFCSVENMEITGGEGYELTQGVTYYQSTDYKALHNIAETTSPSTSVRFSDSAGYQSGDFSQPSAAGYVNTIGKEGDQSPVMCSIPVGSHDYNASTCTHITMVTSDHMSLVGTVRYNGETDPVDFVWPYVWVGSGSTRKIYGGKYPEIFVHFYDANREWMRTVKTNKWTGVIVPDGARTFRVTAYGLCHIVDGKPIVGSYVNAKGNTVSVFNDRLDGFMALPYVFTEGCLVKDCYIHDTRSICHNNICTNGAVIGCDHARVAVAPGRFGLTRLFMDWEEDSFCGGLIAFWNCTVSVDSSRPYEERGKSAIVSHEKVRELDIRGCKGLGLGAAITRSYIADNLIPNIAASNNGGYDSNYQNIIKRNRILSGEFTYTNDGGSRYSRAGNGGNTCDEVVNSDFVVNDCFIGSAGSTEVDSLKGRTFKSGPATRDVYNADNFEISTMKIWNPTLCYVELTTTAANQEVCVTDNSNIVQGSAILDGSSEVTIRNTGSNYGYVTIPTAGRHKLYFQVQSTGKQVAIYGDKVMRIGDNIGGVGNTTKAGEVERIILLPTTPPKKGGAQSNAVTFRRFSSVKKVYVPMSAVEAYKADPLWGLFGDAIKGVTFVETENPDEDRFVTFL